MPTSLLCQVFVLLQRLHSDILILTAKSLSVRSRSYGSKHKKYKKHAPFPVTACVYFISQRAVQHFCLREMLNWLYLCFISIFVYL